VGCLEVWCGYALRRAHALLQTHSTYNSYYLHAQKYRRLVQQDFDAVFSNPNPLHGKTVDYDQKVDILLTPAAVGTAPVLDDVRVNKNPVEECVNDVMTIPASLAGTFLYSSRLHSIYNMFCVGLPALVFPFGNSREDGFPIGLQLISQYGDEEFLFDFAEVFEENVKKGTKK